MKLPGTGPAATRPCNKGLTDYTTVPYRRIVIAEIVRLPGYEAQVAALLDEEERMAMEFFIACTPEHSIIPATGGFRKS